MVAGLPGGPTRQERFAALFRSVTAYAKFVSIRISKVGAIVIGVVLRSDAWSAFVDAAMFQRQPVAFIDQRSACCQKGNHLAITR